MSGKKSDRVQKAARDAHRRGEKALAEGDIYGAIVNDDEYRLLSVQAMLLRMKERREQ